MKSEKTRKKKIRLKSVNTAIIGYFFLLSALLILIVGAAYYIVTITTLTDGAQNRVNTAGAEVAERLTRVPQADPEKLISGYGEQGIYIYIIDGDGNVLHGDSVSAARIQSLLKNIGGKPEGKPTHYRADGFVNFAACVNYGGGEVYLLVSAPLGVIHASVTSAQLIILPLSVAVLLLAMLLAYIISQKLTRGLKNMSNSAIELAHGNYDVQFVNADYREMAQLSDTLNYVRDEVKKSRDFQRDILANVTHDLKTPLTMIKAYASMVQEISGDDPQKRNKHLQVIIDEADRLTGLVNDVLAVSKVNSNLDGINPKVFNLTEYLYGIINKFGYLKESGYSLMVDIDADLYTRADEEKIGQVIYNLLSNAVNYTGEDKMVYISLKRGLDGTRARMSFRDTGKGIPKEELPDIWRRYFRGSDNHNRPVKGTGLGLNIVEVILTNHSFDFGVESSVGQGSVFWVDFPLVSSAPAES